MKQADEGTKAKRRASECLALIMKDEKARELWRSIAGRHEFTSNDGSDLDEGGAFHSIAMAIADLHFVFPLESAKDRLERRRNLQRAIEQFRSAAETYERRSGERLPSLNYVMRAAMPDGFRTEVDWRHLPELDVSHYLAALDGYLADAQGGTCIHAMLSTPTGQFVRNENAAAVVWIIRSLDNVGVPRISKREKDEFLRLAVRLSELFNESGPASVISPSRKDFENHQEFQGQGTMQWRYRPADDAN